MKCTICERTENEGATYEGWGLFRVKLFKFIPWVDCAAICGGVHYDRADICDQCTEEIKVKVRNKCQ